MAEPRVVYQPRCVRCGREQYVLAVPGVSVGELGCSWCGEKAPVFLSVAEYRAALRKVWPREL